MMRFRIFLFWSAFVFLVTRPLFSQEMKLLGRVVDDSTGLPLKRANVYLVKSQKGTTTDEEGIFILKVSPADKNDTLAISFLGYADYRLAVRDFKSKSTIGLRPQSLTLEAVVVSAERVRLTKQEIPHTKQVISLETIERYGSSEIGDLFKTISSIRIEGNDLDGRRIQIRGSNADEVNVYIDGILINSLGIDNSADLSVIPTESIEKIEVLKGGNLTLLGGGAFGGVVYIQTKKKLAKSFLFQAKQGSFRSRCFTAEISLPVSRNFFLNYFGQYNRLFPEIEFFPGERFSEKSRNKSISSKKQNHHINLNYITPTSQLGARFIGYFLDYSKPSWENVRNNFLFALTFKGSLWGMENLDISINRLRSHDEVNRTAESEVKFKNQFKSNRLNLRLTKKYIFGSNEFQFLAEYYHDELESDSRIRAFGASNTLYHALLFDNRASLAGVFSFQDELKKVPNTSCRTYLGARWDYLVTGNKYFAPAIGIEIEWQKASWKITPYYNFGRNFKFPSLLENAFIHWLEISPSDTTLERLQPEFHRSTEWGLHVAFHPLTTYFRGMDFSSAYFSNTTSNKVLRRPFEGFEVTSQVARNRIHGFESSVRLKKLFYVLDLSAAYSRLNISNQLLYAYKPDKNYHFQLDLTAPFGFYLTALYFYEGQSTAWFLDSDGNLQTDLIPPANDMDVSLGFRFGIHGAKFNLQFSGRNVFDNSDFQFYLLKKRFYQVSLTVQY